MKKFLPIILVSFVLFGCNDDKASYKDGLAYEKDGEYIKAEKFYDNLCKKDDLDACYRLVIVKEYLDTSKSFEERTNEKAIKEILTKTCEKNHAPSCRKLAWVMDADFDNEDRFSNVEYFLNKSCNLGDMRACRSLIDGSNARYEFKVSLSNDLRKEMMKKTCEAGILESCNDLKMKNISNAIYEKAREHYKQVCDENNVYYGCFNLAKLYEDGLGGKEDLEEAFRLYSDACESNVEFACYKVGQLYEKGIDGKKDYIKALKYYEKQCKDGNGFACEGIANLYQNGLGVAKSQKKAREYYGIAMGLYDMAMATSGHDEERKRYYELEKKGYEAIY